MTDEATSLGDGRFEERIAVDRRRLEAMITGKPLLDGNMTSPVSAEQFFKEAIQYSGALIFWPAQLKIGAKTKRDPFVKVQGTLDQIDRAKSIITASLQAKKERVTLKIDIHHSVHSHIIGKGGRGIQQIMNSTRCHIHFPDSNKFNETSLKSDQVSISGPPSQIDSARTILRGISPVLLSIELPWLLPGAPKPLAYNEGISWQALSPSLYLCLIRGNAGDHMGLANSLGQLVNHFAIPIDIPLCLRTSVPIKEDVLATLRTKEVTKRISTQLDQLQVEMRLHEGIAVLTGNLNGVLAARKIIIGVCPINLTFECPPTFLSSSVQPIERKFNVLINIKKKNNPQGQACVVIKSTEEYLQNVLNARTQLIGGIESFSSNEYSGGIVDSLEDPFPSPSPFSSSSSFALPSSLTPPIESPKSPDPDNSPLAASILKGIKDLDRNTDRWKHKHHFDRDEMLVKAAQAIFDDTPRSKAEPRYPTDHWSGYGFSCSLPAELLKGMLEVPTDPEPGRPILGREAKTPPSRGLCSVREEDELSDFGGSFSSQSANSLQRQSQTTPKRPSFSASTSIFDSSPVVSHQCWDIRMLTEPSIVLAQIGCSEYLAQMREQEIDMHAFLLLDEQNLKDIGISTIGARKKIHHAIIKLRESARQHGFAI